MKNISRRKFITTASAGGVGLSMISGNVTGKSKNSDQSTRYIAAYDTESPKCLTAVKKIVEIHKRFRMPATFFIVGKRRQSNRLYPNFVKDAMWMASKDNGLAGICYGSCTVSAKVGDNDVPTDAYPWEYPPIELICKAKKVDNWKLLPDDVTPDVPPSPVMNDNKEEDIYLIPFGCAPVRITYFPVTEKTREKK